MRAFRHPLLATALLAAWLLPAAGALALAVHLVHGHPHHAAGGHEGGVAGTARALAHGHTHPEWTPEHDHRAAVFAAAPLPRTVHLAGAVAGSTAAPGCDLARLGGLAVGPRRPPPAALSAALTPLLL